MDTITLDNNSGYLHYGDNAEYFASCPDNSIDLIVTDSPYGISYKSGRMGVDRRHSIDNKEDIIVRESYFEEIENDEVADFSWLKDAYRVLKDGSAIYAFCHWSKWGEIVIAAKEAGFIVKNMIVCNKSNHGMGDLSSWAPKHELVLFATKGIHKLGFPEGRKADVWNVPVKFSGAKRFHSNEKPYEWFIPCIINSSDEGDTVLDCFMGSGTTGVVAVEMGRKFIGCEISKEHFDTAVKRVTEAVDKMTGMIL